MLDAMKKHKEEKLSYFQQHKKKKFIMEVQIIALQVMQKEQCHYAKLKLRQMKELYQRILWWVSINMNDQQESEEWGNGSTYSDEKGAENGL